MSNFKLSPPQINVSENKTRPIPNQVKKFIVQFWGVRGLIASPSNKTNRYGGNTACVEMQVADKRLVFDGGTGLRVLGKSWLELQQPLQAHLFFTNSQSNRIQGFPFFGPAFLPENSFHIYGIAASNGASIKQCLCDQMLLPHFPYPLQEMQSELHFHNLTPGKVIKIDDLTVTTALINQTQKSIGYRVDWQNYSVAYVTDLHDNANEVEQKCIQQLTKEVDLLIANPTTPQKFYRTDRDSHWQTAVDLAHASSAKQLVISHHHPDDHDDFLDHIQMEIKSAFVGGLIAREGLTLVVGESH
ncbi:MBL fold metallo-hydrolase [Chlorogloeopsis fritschii PCC 9212]|uniref:MBL fold metallo-hydrolase n=1 Tax=Chlorogloeopsis fritschii PCC 6912 TaxID=211165 RepID=A0A433NCF3_CHLFR|nr:MBL fold metallo-hydrolase [Chlorogloeopsis fritschii]RUR79670.1 MBL fold metallo-hydrolase [Chlorogloeopsis fritschii PCC 6912]